MTTSPTTALDGPEQLAGFDADVIVVGCGPVGVMAALRCAQRGLRVIAIDRSVEVYPLPRALGMDDEIQDLFARAGLIDELRAHSVPLPGGEFVDASGRQVVGIELPEGTVGALGHPPVVAFDQPSVERFLRAAAIDAGVDMRLGLDAFAVDDLPPVDHGDGDAVPGGVRVGIGNEEADSSLTARWLIAADGAKSTTRSLRGIAMVDQGFDQTWLVVDTTLLDPDLPLPVLARQVCDPARVCTLVPGPGRHRRWEFQLHDHERREDMLDEDVIAELLAPWGNRDQLQVTRSAVYRFHANVAETFRSGPVFLAGDAAHQMPPFNGQGMCTGMRDAENLSWKLAQVASGHGGEPLLDSYDAERRPHAAEQVAHSVDSGLLMQAIAHDGDAALETGYGQRPFPGLEGDLFVDDPPLIGTVLPAPRTTSPPLGDGWNLLRRQQQAGDSADGRDAQHRTLPRLWADIDATVVDVPADAFPGLVDDGLTVIVRPDRYVAAVCNDLGQATAALRPVIAP